MLSFALIAVAVVCTPIAAYPLAPVPGFMTAFATGMTLLNLQAGALMIDRGTFEGKGPGVVLGIAYLLVGATFIPLLISFPDAFVSGSLIGVPGSAVILWSCWHLSFAMSICWYAINTRTGHRVPSPRLACLLVVATTAVFTFAATAGIDYVPSVVGDGWSYFVGASSMVPIAVFALTCLALVLCLRLKAFSSEALWVTVAMVASCVDVWLTMRAGARYSLGWYVAKSGSLLSTLCVAGSLFHELARLYRFSVEANHLLEGLVRLDGLTGVYNRRHFDEVLAMEWGRARRDHTPLTLLLLDVDWFKGFNDEYGHVAGDRALKRVAACLSRTVRRPADLIARYGGEEFAVVLPNTDRDGGLIIAERLREAVEEMALGHDRSLFKHVTASVGMSTRVPGREDCSAIMIEEADKALYAAKGQGRNCVAMADAFQDRDLGQPQVAMTLATN